MSKAIAFPAKTSPADVAVGRLSKGWPKAARISSRIAMSAAIYETGGTTTRQWNVNSRRCRGREGAGAALGIWRAARLCEASGQLVLAFAEEAGGEGGPKAGIDPPDFAFHLCKSGHERYRRHAQIRQPSIRRPIRARAFRSSRKRSANGGRRTAPSRSRSTGAAKRARRNSSSMTGRPSPTGSPTTVTSSRVS